MLVVIEICSACGHKEAAMSMTSVASRPSSQHAIQPSIVRWRLVRCRNSESSEADAVAASRGAR